MPQHTATDHERIYQTLANEILRFEHKPGDLLSENQLCQRFSLSRTPVRSVLQRLQENGLVQIHPHKGSIVTKLDYDVVGQLIYQRVAVESMVLRDFIATCSPAEVERVRYALLKMQQLSQVYAEDRERFDVYAFLKTDLMMHEIWFRATNKLYLWERMSGVESSYTRFCTLDIIEGSNVPDVMRDHQDILHLIEEKNIDGIEPLMRRHLYGGIRRLSGSVFIKYADYFEPLSKNAQEAFR